MGKQQDKNRATVAFYGPNDKRATKMVVGILSPDGDETIDLKRWVSGSVDVRENDKVKKQMREFIAGHDVGNVIVTDRIIGCPHEEGEDYPKGEECPFCPFWAGKNRLLPGDADVLQKLTETPPWEWPEWTGKTCIRIMEDREARLEDRVLAAELAGNYVVVNDEVAGALLALASNSDEPAELRARAAVAQGPMLAAVDEEGFEIADESLVSEQTFATVQEGLAALYHDDRAPKQVRRRALEASVRALQDWHKEAVREHISSEDEDWRLTAVFCTQYVEGFDAEILSALSNGNADIVLCAVRAAGAWGIDDAWPRVKSILEDDNSTRELLFASVEAAPAIGADEAHEVLERFIAGDDEDLAEAAREALAMSGDGFDYEDEFDELDADGDSEDGSGDEEDDPTNGFGEHELN